jgi:hypothetical protein
MENKWLGHYPVLNPEDHDLLEVKAAHHEFTGGMPRQHAEALAHKEYMDNHAASAAAYHYIGMKAAIAAQNMKAAKQHGINYLNAVRHLDANAPASNMPPQAVLDKIKNTEDNPYNFKAHGADGFFQPMQQAQEPVDSKTKIAGLLEKLKAIKSGLFLSFV